MGAPVAEQVVDGCSKSTVREFLTTALENKPAFVVTTDGRSDYAEIVETISARSTTGVTTIS